MNECSFISDLIGHFSGSRMHKALQSTNFYHVNLLFAARRF